MEIFYKTLSELSVGLNVENNNKLKKTQAWHFQCVKSPANHGPEGCPVWKTSIGWKKTTFPKKSLIYVQKDFLIKLQYYIFEQKKGFITRQKKDHPSQENLKTYAIMESVIFVHQQGRVLHNLCLKMIILTWSKSSFSLMDILISTKKSGEVLVHLLNTLTGLFQKNQLTIWITMTIGLIQRWMIELPM